MFVTQNRHSIQDRDTLVEDLLKMLDLGSPNNVKIKLKDGEIEASKDILMARCEYFATMFGNNKFIEGETSSVDMSHCSKAVMEKIIKFLFSGGATLKDLNFSQLLELSHTSEMMLLTKFKVKVDDYLRLDIICGRGLDIKFLPELITGLKLVHQYNLSSIREAVICELYLNLKVISNDMPSSDSFKSLPFNLVRGIFLYKTASCLSTTKQRFEAFMVWLSENEAAKEDKNEIVESFNFEDFTVEELMTSVRNSDLYSGTKIDKRVLVLHKDLTETKDLKIKEQDSKIRELRGILEEAKKYMTTTKFDRFKESLMIDQSYSSVTLDELGLI